MLGDTQGDRVFCGAAAICLPAPRHHCSLHLRHKWNDKDISKSHQFTEPCSTGLHAPIPPLSPPPPPISSASIILYPLYPDSPTRAFWDLAMTWPRTLSGPDLSAVLLPRNVASIKTCITDQGQSSRGRWNHLGTFHTRFSSQWSYRCGGRHCFCCSYLQTVCKQALVARSSTCTAKKTYLMLMEGLLRWWTLHLWHYNCFFGQLKQELWQENYFTINVTLRLQGSS